MVDRDLINGLPPGTKESVEVAFMTLTSSGVLVAQMKQQAEQLTEGFNNADPEELAKKIIDAQQINRVLLGIHELGNQYLKEKSSDADHK